MANDAELKALVVEAIFKQLDEKKREELIRSALAGLLDPSSGSGYNYDRRSKLEKAYDEAVYSVAREEVGRLLKEDKTVREKIEKLIHDAFAKVMDDRALRSQLVDNLAGGISQAFKLSNS